MLCKKWKFIEAKVFAPVAKQIRIRISSKSARSCVVVICTNAQILSSSHNRAAKFYQEILSEGHFGDLNRPADREFSWADALGLCQKLPRAPSVAISEPQPGRPRTSASVIPFYSFILFGGSSWYQEFYLK